jgi:predicted nuclease of predicted toxin-antitoxin system
MADLLLDENLPESILPVLRRHGLTAVHVRGAGFGSTGDRVIWQFATERDLIVLTKDVDYLDLAALSNRGRVILLAVGNMRLRDLCDYMDGQGQAIKDFVLSGDRVMILGD